MARQLTKEAVEKLMNDTKVFGFVCDALDVKPVSLPKLIQRNSARLSHHDVVEIVANAMNKTPDEILEAIEEPATA